MPVHFCAACSPEGGSLSGRRLLVGVRRMAGRRNSTISKREQENEHEDPDGHEQTFLFFKPLRRKVRIDPIRRDNLRNEDIGKTGGDKSP